MQETLARGGKVKVNQAFASLAAVINAVRKHYLDRGTVFDAVSRHNGALTLLYLLGDGLKVRSDREERLKRATESGSDQKIAEALDDGGEGTNMTLSHVLHCELA